MIRMKLRFVPLILALFIMGLQSVWAAQADLKGSADHSMVSRYEGSIY